jgi:hypothetical protein
MPLYFLGAVKDRLVEKNGSTLCSIRSATFVGVPATLQDVIELA